MTSKTKTTANEAYQALLHEYQDTHGHKPYTLRQAAEWMYKHKGVAPRPTDIIGRIALDLRRAARAEYFQDAQGRRVRRNHPRRETQLVNGEEVQMTFWDDILTARPEHMRVSFTQRRTGISYDVKQHSLDFDSYQENNVHGAKLEPYDYNFNLDLAEMEQSTEYPDARPEDEEDED